MAKISIINNVGFITSTLTLDDIKKAKKYRPDALKLYKGEGKDKEVVFSVSPADGKGSIGPFGINFDIASRDGGFAAVGFEVPGVADETALKEKLADQYGPALNYLQKIEDAIPGVVEEINTARTAMMENISIG